MKYPFIQLSLLFLIFTIGVQASDPVAFRIFDSNGKQVSWKKMVKELNRYEIVFFGEQHNDPVGHWLQLRLTGYLYEKHGKGLVLGAEMFETDNQAALSEYIAGNEDESWLKENTRLWSNYKTDYRPLVEFARDKGLSFVASNVPRRYASMVFREGFESLDTLSFTEKSFIAPLPVDYDPDLPGYKNMLSMMQGDAGHGMGANPNFPKAQAIKDATMAWSIFQNMNSNGIFLHFNGAYHSENKEGILWYLYRYRPGTKMAVVTVEMQDDPTKLNEENRGKADFIILVPSDMTKTY